MFANLLNPVLSPLLYLPTLLAIFIISIIISLIIVLVYKYVTDQDLMKRLKTEIKELQAEAKELKSHPEKMMAVQKKAMETNMKYMMHSLKPTLYTFIPIIIIFGWLNAHMAFLPIIDGQEFSTTLNFEEGFNGNVSIVTPDGITLLSEIDQEIYESKADWTMKGIPGEYTLYFNFNSKDYSQNIIITEDIKDKRYEQPLTKSKDGVLDSIVVSNKKMTPFGDLSIFGWNPGWLASYIVFSLVFSILFRKLFKVY